MVEPCRQDAGPWACPVRESAEKWPFLENGVGILAREM